MRNLKFFITLIFNIHIVFCSAQLSALVAKNEKAIFQIFSYDEFGAPFCSGTGFFIKADGTGLTNLHVLKEANFAFIKDINGKTFQIDKIARISEECDLAEFTLMSSPGKTFPFLTTTNVIPAKASDIFVIGNPESLESTVSKGIISAIRDEDGNKIIQISAPISPGSSGSPIMDMNGNVIAVATYQRKEGQNLNFGYWMGAKEKLIANSKYSLSHEGTKNLYVLNLTCQHHNSLILNSIEKNEKNTVVNLTYINTSLSFGDGAFIFTAIGDDNSSFFIRDRSTNKKYYIYDATIGNSAKSPTNLKLGEVKRFKLYFPAISSIDQIDIQEGEKGSSWSFENINLSNYKTFNFEDKNFINDFYFQTGLEALSEKDYVNAYLILNDYSAKNKTNDFAHDLAGIVSYLLGNNLDAYMHIKKALDINPTEDEYYFNLFYINRLNGNIDEAIKNISSAIQLNSHQPEYYNYGAELYMKKEFWKEALADLNKFINSDRTIPAYAYFQRGVALTWLREEGACKDFEKAYSMSTSETQQSKIKEWYNKFCR